MLGLQNEIDTLRPKQSIPRGAGGLHRAGIREYVALGMTTKKHRSVETALTTAGSMRRIANAAGLTTPFVEMTTKEVKALAVAIQSYVNPRRSRTRARTRSYSDRFWTTTRHRRRTKPIRSACSRPGT